MEAIKKAPAAAKKVKPKVEKAEIVVKAKKAPAPKATHFHLEAGLDTSLWGGASSYVNQNRKTKIRHELEPTADLTTRQQKLFYALRAQFGSKPFPSRGLDNGIMAALIAHDMLSYDGGKVGEENGTPYLYDGETPVMCTITKKGAAYGKA